LARVGAPDIGAFESQGFTITVQSGNLQTAALGAAFANPLVASVTAKNAVEPVNGGAVSFTAPASGASATPAAQAVTITGGTATAPLTANATAGFYVVNATANGAGTAQFGLTNGSAAAAKVASVVVGDGSSQRSTVRQLVVNFDSPVLTSGTPASAFSLKRQSDNAVVSLAVAMSPSNTTATITFTGGPLEFGSLADGRYTLGILAGPFSGPGLDGNGNGVGGDDYTLVGDPAAAPRLFRLFGDADGNGTVNSADFLAFRLAFLSSNPTFDFDNNGTVDSADFLALRLNFLKSI
jgi:hypothetical protein